MMDFIFDLQRFADINLSYAKDIWVFVSLGDEYYYHSQANLFGDEWIVDSANRGAKITGGHTGGAPLGKTEPDSVSKVEIYGAIGTGDHKISFNGANGSYDVNYTVTQETTGGLTILTIVRDYKTNDREYQAGGMLTSITGLGNGETVTYDGYIYTSDGSSITRTSKYDPSDTMTISGNESSNLLEGWASPINIATSGVPAYFTVTGSATTEGADNVAAALKEEGGVKTLTVTSKLKAGVIATDSSVKIVDKGTDTVYTLADGVTVTANGAKFISTSGVVSGVTGTMTAVSGTIITTDGSSAAVYNVAAADGVTFRNGCSIQSVKVTTSEGTVTLTESSNTAGTTVASDGTITGVDMDATIKGAVNGKTITTTGSGTININGADWKVTGDDDGATFTVNTGVTGQISGVTGLASGAVLSTTSNVSGITLFGCTINNAKNGFSYTEGTFTLTSANDSITTSSYTYTLNKVSDGISIDTAGNLSGLTNGEKVTMVKGTDTYTYEVTGDTMVTTKTAADGTVTTTTSILSEGETGGFKIDPSKDIKEQVTNKSTDPSKAMDMTGFVAGSTEINQITTVTNGMLLDKKGHATASSDKAIAEVDIKDDGSIIKYESKKNVKQTVQITGGTNNWDITTSEKADTIMYAGNEDATISSRDGNDSITVSGKADVVINGDSGKNKIVHMDTGTGIGDATINGGTGNSTIESSNPDDVIYGGGGENTFVLTGAQTSVRDFTYGNDKAVVSSVAGALDIMQIKTYSEGLITYTGTGSVTGSLDVSDQDYGGFYAVTLADSEGKNKKNVGWTGTNGGMIDAYSLEEKVLLFGNDSGFFDTLIGGKSGDTIVSGAGSTSMWGSAGNDIIISDANSSNSIFFLEGDGSDTVQGFTAYDGIGNNDADTLDLYGQGITDVKLTSEGIKVYHGSDRMLLSGSYDADTMIRWKSGESSGVAKIGKQGEDNTFTYSAEITNYFGSSGTDKVKTEDIYDNVNIWLDGSHGVSFDNINVIDASQAMGLATLAGGVGKNTIIGGKGESSLWGGAGSDNDMMQAGSGRNEFFYGLGEGNDTITGTKDSDTVNLYNLNLSDLTGAVIENNKITITQTNGQKLTVSGQANTFTLADGSTWVADHSTKGWTQKS